MFISPYIHEANIAFSKELSKSFKEAAECFEQYKRKFLLFPFLASGLKSGDINHVDASRLISECVHGNQKRNSGAPAMTHINAALAAPDLYPEIFKGVPYTDKEIQIVNMHDVVEDSRGAWTIKDLRYLRFDEDVVLGVDGASKHEGEPYYDRVEIGSALLTLRPKIGESLHNNSDNPTEKAKKKYSISLPYQIAVLNGEIAPASSIVDFALSRGLYDPELLQKYSSRRLNPSRHFASTTSGFPTPVTV